MKLAFSMLLGFSCLALVSTSACSSSSPGGGTTSSGDGGPVVSANVTTLATGQKNPGGIVSNGTNVSWTTCNNPESNLNGPGSIMTMPVGGGAPVALATNADNAALLATDNTNVYWTAPDDNAILKAPIANTGEVTLVKNLVNSPLGVAVDATNVYWVTGGGIQSVPIIGGSKTEIDTKLSLQGVYQTPDVAVNASGVFATTADGIVMVPLTGGTAVTIVTGQNPNSIAVDASNVYWSNLGNAQGVMGTIMKAPTTANATPVTIATLGSTAVPVAVAVDANDIYWVEGLGDVKKAPLAGGAAVSLAKAPTLPGGIAVDATSVYWTDTPNGAVYKTAK